MATGDSNDILQRVKAVLPRRWFSWGAPLRDAILGGVSDSAAWAYAWIVYARKESRLATMDGPWLDITSNDFLGFRFPRRGGERDDDYRARILKEILRPRQTRAAILQQIKDLTGKDGRVFEFWNPLDCGAYGSRTLQTNNGQGNIGYNTAGCYGTLRQRNQILVHVTNYGGGIPNVGGYNSGAMAYGTRAGRGNVGYAVYSTLDQVSAPVTDAEVYQRISETIAEGITAWVNIVN